MKLTAEQLAEKCIKFYNHGKSEESINFACESCINDVIQEARDNE